LLSLGFKIFFEQFTSFFVLSYVGFLLNMMTTSSSWPIMNVHDISSYEEVPLVSTRYDSNNVGNVQVAREGGELEIPKVVNVGKDDSNAYITKMHLENL
jgi:hypothetical protein